MKIKNLYICRRNEISSLRDCRGIDNIHKRQGPTKIVSAHVKILAKYNNCNWPYIYIFDILFKKKKLYIKYYTHVKNIIHVVNWYDNIYSYSSNKREHLLLIILNPAKVHDAMYTLWAEELSKYGRHRNDIIFTTKSTTNV